MSYKGMRFCRQCDNMLQPKEQVIGDEQIGQLIYYCRICGENERANPRSETENCVYKSEQSKTDNFKIDVECIKDPCLSRRIGKECAKCGNKEAVTFTNPTKDRMNLIFVCTQCTYYWKKEELDEGDVLSGGESD